MAARGDERLVKGLGDARAEGLQRQQTLSVQREHWRPVTAAREVRMIDQVHPSRDDQRAHHYSAQIHQLNEEPMQDERKPTC